MSQNFTVPSAKSATPQQVAPVQSGKAGKSQLSPAKYIPTPSPQMHQSSPSPAQSAPSPAYINPPSVGPAPSPLTQEEEKVCLDKLKEMNKYVEPLTKLIAQMSRDGEHKREKDKMNAATTQEEKSETIHSET